MLAMSGSKRKRVLFGASLAACFIVTFTIGLVTNYPSSRKVPDLIGLGLEEARAVVESGGFTLMVKEQESGPKPVGIIISQDPEPGMKAEGEMVISVVICKGDLGETVTLPDLIGMTEDEAKEGLKGLGLTANITYEWNVSFERGTIFRQDPGAGEEVPVGDIVRLTVSEGGSQENNTVCLDPGHADTPYHIDEETGLNTQDWANEPEIQIVFDIAMKAKDLLEARGVRVVMTKGSVYEPVDLKRRAVIANQAGAALVLHIHTDPGISAPTTFFPGSGEMGWKANSDSGGKAYIDARVQRESERLARVFHAAMSSYMLARYGLGGGGVIVENRGSTGTGNYGPIFSYDVWSKIPTFTIENNQAFAEANRREVAEAIVEGIMACLGEL